MRKQLLLLVACIMFLALTPGTVGHSHPGGLDANGGHHVRTPGWGYPVGSYHYHRGPYSTGTQTISTQQGYTRADIVVIQASLNQVGYDCGAVDGIIGIKTIQAIRVFQEDSGLNVDGIAGAETLTALLLKLAVLSQTSSVPAQTGRALGKSEIMEVQTRLNELGFDCGEVDGIVGPRTRAATRAFQEDNNLVVDGVVGPKTLRALGLD